MRIEKTASSQSHPFCLLFQLRYETNVTEETTCNLIFKKNTAKKYLGDKQIYARVCLEEELLTGTS